MPFFRRVVTPALTLLFTPRFVSAMATPVNLLDLASAAIACTEVASRLIRNIASPDTDSNKNTRLKPDGSFVTDADFLAQGVILRALQTVSMDMTIVGEESPEEMAQHMDQVEGLDPDVLARAQREVRLRYHGVHESIDHWPLASLSTHLDVSTPLLPDDPPECLVDASRIRIFVDPLDGTKSYAQGDYDCVSILIGVMVDDRPVLGIVGKPFGYTGLDNLLDSGCATIYGGPLLRSVCVAGTAAPLEAKRPTQPRAVISGSRSQGIVHDFCVHLGAQGLLHPKPLHVNGAGEKSLRLILQHHDEALWFFPKAGTSLWDVAASDALLQALGGKLTDRYGNAMDYSKSRHEAENKEGVVACIDPDLHRECLRIFHEWQVAEKDS